MHDTITVTTRSAVLTDKGECVRLIYKLVQLLGVLPDDDRQAVRELLEAELDDA